MTFETKFNIGDTVYTFEKNKIKEFVISEISTKFEVDEDHIKEDIKYAYDNKDGFSVYYPANKVYSSKEELINSLL